MSKRNHRILWEQLKLVLIHNKKKCHTKKELLELITSLEISQLAPDPIASMFEAMESQERKDK